MGRFSMDSTIKEIIEDKEARAIIERLVPNILNHPMISFGYSYTIGKALAYSKMIGISEETEKSIKNELFALL
ncbi:MAG: hypothetical protein RR033_04755 [Clostridia bacterium]